MTAPLPPAFDGGQPAHGGDLAAASARYGEPAAGWIDLSTGISPVAYPFQPPPLAVSARLPGRELENALAEAAHAYYASYAPLVIGAGTQAFIQTLPRLRNRARVAVLSPTYSEHAAAWAGAGHGVEEVADFAALGDYDVAVAVNPNNPDGREIAPESLLRLADDLAAKDGLLVVDEAFGDVRPELSIAGMADRPGLVVLRSFGKFFGLAGVRLGFAFCHADMAAALTRALGPWPVSGPALDIGRQALGDSAWQAAQRRRLNEDKARLDAMLAAAGLDVAGGTALFRLVRTDAAALHRGLAERGIWTRVFTHSLDVVRIGLPAGEAEWERLQGALENAITR